MSKKTKYVPPAAELILLAPCENLAVDDWAFGNAWRTQWGKFRDTATGASGVAFGGNTFDKYGTDGDFFTKTTGTGTN